MEVHLKEFYQTFARVHVSAGILAQIVVYNLVHAKIQEPPQEHHQMLVFVSAQLNGQVINAKIVQED